MEAMRKRQAEFMAGLGPLSDEEVDEEGGEGGNKKSDDGTASQVLHVVVVVVVDCTVWYGMVRFDGQDI